MRHITQPARRIALGWLAGIAVLLILDFVPAPIWPLYRVGGFFWVGPILSSFLHFLPAAAIGAYVAKVRFTLPAMGLAVAAFLLQIYIANTIAAAFDQANYVEVFASNSLGLASSIFAAIIGSGIGHRLSRATASEVENAA